MPRLFHTSYSAATLSIEQAREIGNAVFLLGWSKKYAELALAQALQSIRPAIALRQYRTYYAEDGTPSALITWGWLSEHTLRSQPVRPLFALPPSEWNEGENLCIFDVLSPPDDVAFVLADFLDNLVPDEMNIYTYPALLEPQPASFSLWKRGDRAALVASLEAQ